MQKALHEDACFCRLHVRDGLRCGRERDPKRCLLNLRPTQRKVSKTQHELIVAASMTKVVKVAGSPYLSDSCECCPECDGYQDHSV